MSHSDELARQGALLALLAEGDMPSGALAGHADRLDPGDQARQEDRDHAASAQRARLRPDIPGKAGLRAYQRNAQATAQRVLLAHFPTIAAMLGEETLAALALILWRAQPPASGDLGEWGAGLPELLAAHPDLQDWPWLADSARLDWARHLCERAANATLDAASLQRLGDTAPERLRLVWMPGMRLLRSPWPVLALWAAHQLPQEAQEQAVRTALPDPPHTGERPGTSPGTSSGAGHHVLIWRGTDWRVDMRDLADLPEAEGLWMRMLLAGDSAPGDTRPPSLSELLDQAPQGLDFGAWLAKAVTSGWLWRVDVMA